jgi:predicted dehydrogenase
MAEGKVRWLLVGCGEHASVILHPALSFIAEAEIVACCDIDHGRADTTARRYGLRCYYDLGKMLRNEKADVALVVSYPYIQAQLVAQCLEAGIHVFTEKPLAMELSEAATIRQLSEIKNLKVGVGFMKRYNPAYRKMHKAIRSEEFGAPSLFYGKFAGGYRPRTQDLLRVGAIHLFDLARYLIGDVKSLVASKREIEEGKASIAVHLEFKTGCVGSLHLSSLGFWSTRWMEYAEIIGDRNAFVVDNCRNSYWQKAPLSSENCGTTQSVREVPAPTEFFEPNYSNISLLEHQAFFHNGYYSLLRRFNMDLFKDSWSVPGIEEGTAALRIALAIEESIETHHRITVPLD